MKIDSKEQAKQLCLDFDSVSGPSENVSHKAYAVGLKLAYSSDSVEPHSADSSRRETTEREMIISQTVSFARKLSW